MALDPAFVADCPYGPGGLLIDDIIEIDEANGRVVAQFPTSTSLPLTREQRNHPVRHPAHVSGGLMVHMTGMVGFVHAYYVLGLRHADGWIGYGVRIHDARFAALASPGAPMLLEARATRVRHIREQYFARYRFHFTQAGTTIYEGDQTAIWQRVTEQP